MINSMEEFQTICRKHLIEWYSERYGSGQAPMMEETYVVWSCKTLQNMKCLVSTALRDNIYAEYTYNGDMDELYEDIYTKIGNRAISGKDCFATTP